MQEIINKEVQDALMVNPETITFEPLQSEDSSPLNQPVIEKDIGGEQHNKSGKTWNVWKPKSTPELENQQGTETNFRDAVETSVEEEKASIPLDAPEQEIGNTIDEENPSDISSPNNKDFELPLTQANQAADAVLGMTNNVLAVGGGYFVKLKKHKTFYEFEEIIQVIDQQNDRNLERIKLSKEDQILLRPLLAQVLRQKTKQLTPEQQLMGAILSILVKKTQVVLEIRAENSLLESRILDIIREQKEVVPQEESNFQEKATDTNIPDIPQTDEETSISDDDKTSLSTETIT